MALAVGVASASGTSGPGQFQPGAPGLGDPYFPLDGNGGYDVQHYLLDVTYDPATDVLTGVATIRARATQDLSQFNLDFVGLTVDRSTSAAGLRRGHVTAASWSSLPSKGSAPISSSRR